MNCCGQCRAFDEQFGPARAGHDLRRYQQKGPDKTTKMMLSALREWGVSGATLVDVGAGVGVLHHELLGEGLAAATHVEASSAYVTEARNETARRGNSDRVSFIEGDVVDVAPQVADADVVTMDRVVCCYPDYRGLLRAAAGKARSVCAMSYPRDRRPVRVVVALSNFLRRLRRSDFRVFVHPSAAVDAAMRELGFRQRSRETTTVWQVVLYQRSTG
jgi:2-polyprenyl-3-methyl-5-hydroxy-6-metoxy-1,4-benzoquinol methylase